jgi:hypothetical protein
VADQLDTIHEHITSTTCAFVGYGSLCVRLREAINQSDAMRNTAKCVEGSISRGWRSVTRARSGIYGRVFEPGELAAHIGLN